MIWRAWWLCVYFVVLGACAPPARVETATVVPTATPTVLPTPASMMPFRETFDSNAGRVRTGTTGNARFTIDNGRYTITVTETNTLAWSTIGGMLADGSAETDVIFERGTPATAAGLMFRVQDGQNFYMASLSSDGFYALDARENGTWRSIIEWTPWPTIDTRGEANRLRVVTQSSSISLYLDGVLLAQTADTAFDKGSIALGVNTYDIADVSIQFDNLSVAPATAGAKKE